MLMSLPRIHDPRWRFAAILLIYAIIGINFLGFNRSPTQIFLTVTLAGFFDIVFHRLFKGEFKFPLSAVISGLSLSIILNYAHGIWLPVLPVFVTIASKYLFTHKGKHIFNPSLFGIAFCLSFSQDLITPAASFQWGGTLAASLFIITAALVLFLGKIKRTVLVGSFLVMYTLATAIRAYSFQYIIPFETLFLSTISSPAFFLFSFFMITDPATSPESRKEQFFVALSLVFFDTIINFNQVLFSYFYAAFATSSLRWLLMISRDHLNIKRQFWPNLRRFSKKFAVIAIGYFMIYSLFFSGRFDQIERLFHFERADVGIIARPSPFMEHIDDRVAHLGKWLISIGDAAVVGDFNNDGLPDLFLSQSLKAAEDRGVLYKNLGQFKFEKIALPVLDQVRKYPKRHGYISGGLWFDFDNDRDLDLLVLIGYGRSLLLQNQLKETGQATFQDVSREVGFNDYTISVTANVFDYNRDGWLDIILSNVFSTELKGYSPTKIFNVFDLPQAEHFGDRRMFNFMHRTWHNANNGGRTLLYRNSGGKFSKVDPKQSGLTTTRWTLDIGTGDFDRDGWTDLYFANDFGPDELYLNEKGARFTEVKGNLVGELGKDPYKSMNAAIVDLDGNGFPDVYVSNVHHKLQAEGSMLWMNDGQIRKNGFRAMQDEAVSRNALNENRFGWGGAVGDLDRDGRLDIVQANGFFDDLYDRRYENCPDYWYWISIVSLGSEEIHGYADQWGDLRGWCLFPQESNRVYINRGRFFVDVADQVGLIEKDAARAATLADFDNDGDLDLVITRMTKPPAIYQNNIQNKNSWIGLHLIGDGEKCSTDAIGTQVEIQSRYQEVQASNSLSSQKDIRLFFGLGEIKKSDSKTKKDSVSVKIYWCGNKNTDERILAINRYHTVRQQKLKMAHRLEK